MTYKAFQDFYRETKIKHLLLTEYNGALVSPPFATEQCKNYSSVLVYKDGVTSFIKLNIPPVTSKFNAMVTLGDSLWFVPYGIWDDFNIVVELRNFNPVYHKIDKPGKGQFYSIATNGETAFSFPLGYQDTSFGLYINNGQVHTIDFNNNGHTKLHMGTVWCNGRYWSPPRSDTRGYVNVVSYDGDKLKQYKIDSLDTDLTRKYSDFIVKGNILYSLPFGEQSGMNEVLEFNTDTTEYSLYKLNCLDFAKKFNCMVMLDDIIIGLPYGNKTCNQSNWGVSFNTVTKESKSFDIGKDLSYGGKYRFKCGIEYEGIAVFLPSGTPNLPIISVDRDLIIKKLYINNVMFGRPIIHENKLTTLGYDMIKHTISLYKFDRNLTLFSKIDIA
jgi:hypothetical protein